MRAALKLLTRAAYGEGYRRLGRALARPNAWPARLGLVKNSTQPTSFLHLRGMARSLLSRLPRMQILDSVK